MTRALLLLVLLVPAVASAQPDTRPVTVTLFSGLTIDTFAADDLTRYLNPEAATGEQVRLSAGLDFAYHLTPTGSSKVPVGNLWLLGQARYGVRSADVDCRQDTRLAVCMAPGATPSRESWLYVLRHARTVEASAGLRWDLWRLNRDSPDPAVLYVVGRAGVLTVAGSGDDASDQHVVATGVLVTGGTFQGSYLEGGWGRSDVYALHPIGRLRVDGEFRLGRYRRLAPFVRITVDADLQPGPDSIQTHIGVSWTP